MNFVEISDILVNPKHIVFIEYNKDYYHNKITCFFHLSTGKHIKKVFFDFMESLNITLFKVSNILGFTFLIPLLPLIYELSSSEISQQDINKIVKIITSYGVITISSVTLKEILTKLIKRFRG